MKGLLAVFLLLPVRAWADDAGPLPYEILGRCIFPGEMGFAVLRWTAGPLAGNVDVIADSDPKSALENGWDVLSWATADDTVRFVDIRVMPGVEKIRITLDTRAIPMRVHATLTRVSGQGPVMTAAGSCQIAESETPGIAGRLRIR
jgi:hypothetical protein